MNRKFETSDADDNREPLRRLLRSLSSNEEPLDGPDEQINCDHSDDEDSADPDPMGQVDVELRTKVMAMMRKCDDKVSRSAFVPILCRDSLRCPLAELSEAKREVPVGLYFGTIKVDGQDIERWVYGKLGFVNRVSLRNEPQANDEWDLKRHLDSSVRGRPENRLDEAIETAIESITSERIYLSLEEHPELLDRIIRVEVRSYPVLRADPSAAKKLFCARGEPEAVRDSSYGNTGVARVTAQQQLEVSYSDDSSIATSEMVIAVRLEGSLQ